MDADELQARAKVSRETIESVAASGEIRSSPTSIASPRAMRRPAATQRHVHRGCRTSVDRQQPVEPRHTLIEVTGLDRPGFLYRPDERHLGKLNLNIGSAHIVTFGEKAVDVFYVTDLAGGKIANPGRQATIRKALLAMFGPGHDPVMPRDAA